MSYAVRIDPRRAVHVLNPAWTVSSPPGRLGVGRGSVAHPAPRYPTIRRANDPARGAGERSKRHIGEPVRSLYLGTVTIRLRESVSHAGSVASESIGPPIHWRR